MRALKTLIGFAAAILILSSCASQRKQSMRAHQYFRENPAELAQLAAEKFPSKTEYIPGKTITVTDTTIVTDTVTVTVDCPDGSTVTADCPPNKTITIRDTTTRIDTIYRESVGTLARIEQYRLEAEKYKTDTAVARSEKEAAESKAKKLTWGLIGIIVAAVGYGVLRFKRII